MSFENEPWGKMARSMRNLGRRIVATALAATLAACVVAAPRKKPSVHALKGRLGSVRKRRQALRVEIHETRAKARTVKRTIVVVDGRLTQIKARLFATGRELAAARRDQATAARRLADTSSELAKTRQRARTRLRAIAKQGDANVLVAFVTARSAADLAERKDLMERIACQDHRLFARVRALRATVAGRKRERDAATARAAALADRQRAQQADLRAVRVRKGAELHDLREKEADDLGALRQFDEDEREIRRLIALARVPVRRPGHRPVPAFVGRLLRPVDAPVTSGFGMRDHPILHIRRLHAGVDFGTPVGTPVRCAAPGRVVAATVLRGFGNVVIVDHGGGLSTVYAHLSRIAVRAGQRLTQGAVLGASGNSGLSTGPHLHWEVHVGGRAVNPMGRF